MCASAENPSEKVDFKGTLNLPKTDFPLRAESKKNDPLMCARWEREELFAAAQQVNRGQKSYILHDGPPYANGNMHLGHAYNKILKDIIAKSRRMMGYYTPVVPGWDCHGLPIEQKVSQEQPQAKGAELMAACRAYAMQWVGIQRGELKQLGVLMDWEHPYLTADSRYEASIVRTFAQLVRSGFVERKNKTIPWCPTCRTALASAEIEYEDRKDPSVFVLFDLEPIAAKEIFPEVALPISLIVWTTTPWTLPLNRAVMMKEGAEYALLESAGRFFVVGADRTDYAKKIIAKAGLGDAVVHRTVSAKAFANARVHHPVDVDRLVPIILDGSVGLDEGTACVHCAPGCGPIDYEVAVKNGLEIYSPISADGRYAEGIVPVELVGMAVSDGQEWVQRTLKERGTILYTGTIEHSYPHCWRCHKGLIFRATPQWFCRLDHKQAKETALSAIEKMNFYPSQGRNFLRATVENRWEWCLSRQRVWGVPIPALLNGDEVFVDADMIDRVANYIEKNGIEYWSRTPIEGLVHDGIITQSVAEKFTKKESDILDVWFDAGVSHEAVLGQREGLSFPADLYLEGIDQHRGWFQSSLLTSIMLGKGSPTRAIMTHGFTVDQSGRKMSKSLGNVVPPQKVIDAIGTDGLRLWVASVGNEGDAVMSDQLIQNVGQVYRKIRNTCRFLLQNLFDFDYDRDALPLTRLEPFDTYALRRLCLLNDQVIGAYERYELSAVYALVNEYCAVEISALYGDVAKDVLYCDAAAGQRRRSIQTVFWHILDTLTKLIAPIMSFAAEEVSDFYQKNKNRSIHLQPFASVDGIKDLFAQIDTAAYDAEWESLCALRSAIMKLIEEQRAAGVVHHPLEATVTIKLQEGVGFESIKNLPEFLALLLIVSQVRLVRSAEGLNVTGIEGLFARVEHAAGVKCPRCWQWSEVPNANGLCPRCQQVVG